MASGPNLPLVLGGQWSLTTDATGKLGGSLQVVMSVYVYLRVCLLVFSLGGRGHIGVTSRTGQEI